MYNDDEIIEMKTSDQVKLIVMINREMLGTKEQISGRPQTDWRSKGANKMQRLCVLLSLMLMFSTVSCVFAEGIVIPEFTIGPKELPVNEGQTMVNNMLMGYNLGNCFDAYNCSWLKNEMEYETAWCGAKATEALFDTLKEAGFKTIRLPVSWHNHLTDKENYTISEPWLKRVQEVVDWCIDRDMYVILNIHHDNSTDYLYPSNKYKDQTMKYLTSIWSQLAERFGDYDEHLLFETMNEMRLVDTKYEWYIDKNAAECKEAIAVINEMNQTFVDLVRNSGHENNKTRYLIVPGYDASPEAVLNEQFVVPTDPVANDHHIILGVHAYTPYSFALDGSGTNKWSIDSSTDKSNVAQFMQNLYNKYVSQGQPVMLTEFGAQNKKGNLQARVEWTAYYVASARVRGITCIWWDNNATTGTGELFGIIDRKTVKWVYPEIAEAMKKYAQ